MKIMVTKQCFVTTAVYSILIISLLINGMLLCAEMSDMEKVIFNQLGEDLKISYFIVNVGDQNFGTVDVETISDGLLDVFYGIIAQHDEKNILNKNYSEWSTFNQDDGSIYLSVFFRKLLGEEKTYLYGVARILREKKKRVWSDKSVQKRIAYIKMIDSWDVLQKEIERFFDDLQFCNKDNFEEFPPGEWELGDKIGHRVAGRIWEELKEKVERAYYNQNVFGVPDDVEPAAYKEWKKKFSGRLKTRIKEVVNLQTVQQ